MNIKTGYGKINYLGLAVGKNIDPTTGVAADKATFVWDLTAGVTKVNVTGKFAVIDRSGVPVRLDLYYYDGLNGTGTRVSSNATTGFTPASDALVSRVSTGPRGAPSASRRRSSASPATPTGPASTRTRGASPARCESRSTR